MTVKRIPEGCKDEFRSRRRKITDEELARQSGEKAAPDATRERRDH